MCVFFPLSSCRDLQNGQTEKLQLGVGAGLQDGLRGSRWIPTTSHSTFQQKQVKKEAAPSPPL